MDIDTTDYHNLAIELLKWWHEKIRQTIQERIPQIVLNMLTDVGRAERIVYYSRKSNWQAQWILTMTDLLILSLTNWTTRPINQGLEFSLNGIKNGNEIISLRSELATAVKALQDSLYAKPSDIVMSSSSYYPRQLGRYYKTLDKREYDLLTRSSTRRCFEFASRQTLDGDRNTSGNINSNSWPYFANLLDTLFPERNYEFAEAWDYFFIFTNTELIIQKPDGTITKIRVNDEFLKIFPPEKSKTDTEANSLIERFNWEINSYIQTLVALPNNVTYLHTDIKVSNERDGWSTLWFWESHDCEHISDPEVIQTLQRIIWYFGEAIPRYFPQSLINTPWESTWRIRIYSTWWADNALYRIWKASSDTSYYKETFLKWNDCWCYAFLNSHIEELYTKKWQNWADFAIVCNLLATIYRHLLVDLENIDNKKMQKWKNSHIEWLKLMKQDATFSQKIKNLKDSRLYTQWVSENMVWLALFVKYGYLAYSYYSSHTKSDTIEAPWTAIANNLLIPQEISLYFSQLFWDKKTKNVWSSRK